MNQIETISEWIKKEGDESKKISIQIKMKMLSHVRLSVCKLGYFY